MKEDANISIVTERGQVSIPAALRKALHLGTGQKLLWEKVSDNELRVRTIDKRKPAGALSVLGFARRFRPEPRSTRDWMAELREGER